MFHIVPECVIACFIGMNSVPMLPLLLSLSPDPSIITCTFRSLFLSGFHWIYGMRLVWHSFQTDILAKNTYFSFWLWWSLCIRSAHSQVIYSFNSKNVKNGINPCRVQMEVIVSVAYQCTSNHCFSHTHTVTHTICIMQPHNYLCASEFKRMTE